MFLVHINYEIANREYNATVYDNYEDENISIKLIINREKDYKRLTLCILPITELLIDKLYINMDFEFNKNQKVFVNGYQSWTDSREFDIDEKISGITPIMRPIASFYKLYKYGDYSFKKYSKKSGILHGYTYSYIKEGDKFVFIGSLSERQGFTIIEHNTRKNEIVIEKDCKDHMIFSEYKAFDMVFIEGDENMVFDRYFELMKLPKVNAKPMTGWTSWYNYYQNINEDIIIKNLNAFKEKSKTIDVFQIDDGYQSSIGDWLSIDSKKFPRGMEYISGIIHNRGYMAGIWLAPFICETNSILFKEKYDWILKDEKGEPVIAGSNWSGFYALDFYNDEIRQYIKNVFDIILNKWNYDLVKLDFLYAVCLIPRKHKTRGQIMTEAMEFLRECVKEKLILGCGVPLGAAFGRVDYCRIGCDVSLDWDDLYYMRFLHRERVSTLNAIKNTIGRRQLNHRAFLNDPDVFLLRDTNTDLNTNQKETLSIVNTLFGSLLFTSDCISLYNESMHLYFDFLIAKKERTIIGVKDLDNAFFEIEYIEEGALFLALINLSTRSFDYTLSQDFSYEFLFATNEKIPIANKNIKVFKYKSRIFTKIS